MKKTYSKIKLAAIMAFASIASLISKALGQVGGWESTQGFYGVSRGTPIMVKQQSSSSVLAETIVKYVEWALVGVIFLIGIINYFKIKKIDDKELRKKKIKKTINIIVIIAIIDILISLGYRMYENNMFDNILGK